MIGNALLWFALRRFNPRGKHFLLRTWDRLCGSTRARTPNGVMLNVRLGSAQDLTFLREPGADELAQRIALLPHGAVFIDVGANIGYYTILARRAVGPNGLCIACEPSRREFLRLTQHLDINASADVLAINAALGNAPSVAMLRVAPHHTGLNDVVFTSQHPHDRKSTEAIEPCLVATLDTILDAACPGRDVDLLKIDVEGAELAVLTGANRALARGVIRTVVVEVTASFLSRHGHTVEALYEFMEARSYRGIVGRQNVFQYDETFVHTTLSTPT